MLVDRVVSLGSLAEQYFSTKDEASIDEFLKQCDVLVASLPETPKTRFILNAKKLGKTHPFIPPIICFEI